MFTEAERSDVRDALAALAREDDAIDGAATVGSAARGAEDAWSDVDLVLQLASDADEPTVVARWSDWLSRHHAVADTFDVYARGIRYRVFLLASSLQIDISFWPHDEFRATDDGFVLHFGEANAPTAPPAPDAGHTIGMGWLYAIHARSAIARDRTWQAVLMLDELRDAVLSIACVNHGLNPWHGREADRLPVELLERLSAARARTLSSDELRRSLAALTRELSTAVGGFDAERAARLAPALARIADS